MRTPPLDRRAIIRCLLIPAFLVLLGSAILPLSSFGRAPTDAEIDDAIRQAGELFQSGEFNAGLLLLQGMRDLAGDRASILSALGDGYRSMRLWDESDRFYRDAARADSTYGPAWAGLGQVLFEAQKADSARLALERASTLNSKDVISLGLLGELALERQDLPEAKRVFSRILELEGETLDALTDLAVVHERSEEYEAARTLLDRAAHLYPKSVQAQYNLAVLESLVGRFHEAVLAANKALALEPDNLEVLRFLGVLYFENQVCPEAVRYFRQVLAASPLDLDVRIGLASCLHALGKSDEAIQELKSALNETEKDYDLLLLMANIRLEQNRLDEALETARHAAELDSLRPDARYLEGLILRRLGREEEAEKAFKQLEKERSEKPGEPHSTSSDGK